MIETEDVLEQARDSEESRITDEKIQLLQERIGVPSRRDLRPSFEYAALDNMRNYARGIGDINPFYRDVAQANSGPWGRLTAHPTFMLYMGVRELASQSSDEGNQTSGDPLAGVHSFYSGDDIRWYRPIAEGDRFLVRSGLASAEPRPSKMGGRSVHETREWAYRDESGRLVGVRRKLRIRVDRKQARSQKKYADLDVPHRYSVEEMAAIEADYEREYVRGSEIRFFEDVEIGERSTPLVRGPYTTTAYICYAEATGPRNDFHRAHSDAIRYRRNHPRAFPLNELGYPDTVARVHWDRDMAHRAGLPETYDFGGERVAWMSNVATNWMGDHGFLHYLKVRLLAFCYVGDTVWLNAQVTDKRVEGDVNFVDLELEATNQRSETIARGVATVALPSKSSSSRRVAPIEPKSGETVF